MVDLTALRTARPDELDTAARSWQVISTQLGTQVSNLTHDVVTPLTGLWSGQAADSARTALSGRASDLGVTREYANTMAAVLRDAATGIADAQAYLKAAEDLASRNHLALSPNGSVVLAAAPLIAPGHSAPSILAFPQALPPAAAEVSALVERAIAAADEVDAQITARLRDVGLFSGVSTGNLAAAKAQLAAAGRLSETFDRSAVPSRGSNPAEVNAWWGALSESERSRLISEFPSQIGWLDGLPAIARSEANVLAMNREKTQLTRQLQSLGQGESSQQVRQKLAQISGLENGMAIAAAYAGRDNVFLLGFDTDGNGHAIVAVGNPDTATDSVTYVPGLGSNVSGSAGDIQRSALLWQRAGQFAPSAKVSSIYWLGYDAPQLSASPGAFAVAGTGDATAGAARLSGFQSGLGAAHQPGVPDHTTVVGHSYGSLVVGEAAAHDSMHPGDLIFVGSPGVGVDHAAQLGMSPAHVWSGANSHDPVPQIGADLTGNPNKDWFGNNPAGSDFGGKIFNADIDPDRTFGYGIPGGLPAHSAYWDPHSSSLDNMAHIADGQYGRVLAGRPPPYTPTPTPPTLTT